MNSVKTNCTSLKIVKNINNLTDTTTCNNHIPNKIECRTRMKLIEKGVYCAENSEFLWEKAYYRITDNLRGRDRIAFGKLMKTTFEQYENERNKCQQAHEIHCVVANYLNFRHSFFGFYT